MPVTMTEYYDIFCSHRDSDDATFYEILLHFVPDMIPHSYIFGVTAYPSYTKSLQNTRAFYGTESVSAKSVSEQIGAVLDDFDVSAVKIGMLHTVPVMRAVQKRLKDVRCPIIVDPVVASTTGGILLPAGTIKEFQRRIVPLAYAVTPNMYECGIISGTKCNSISKIASSASILISMGAKNVIVTGIVSDKIVRDYIFGESEFSVQYKKNPTENHGGGCTFSSALAGYMAAGNSFEKSTRMAGSFAQKFIKNSRKIGRGVAIAGSKRDDLTKDELADAVYEFANMKNASKLIPECQTNFVYAMPKPKTINDVFGVRGRIVRTGKSHHSMWGHNCWRIKACSISCNSNVYEISHSQGSY